MLTQEAFCKVFVAKENFLTDFLRKQEGDEAPDIVRDWFIRCLEKSEYETIRHSNTVGWMMRCIKIFAAERFRNAHKHFYPAKKKLRHEYETTQHLSPEQNMLNEENNQLRKKCESHLPELLDTLSPYQRKLVNAYYFESLSSQEIAKKLNTNAKAVIVNINVAMRNMHQKFTGRPRPNMKIAHKLTPQQVQELRQRWYNNEFKTYVEAAKAFGISRTYAASLIKGNTRVLR